MAGFIVAEIPLYAQPSASDIAAEVARRCNEYNELKARVAKLENLVSQHDARTLLEALAGCADALHEAGKDFAQANKLAVRPNLYELHEQAARAAIAKATGGAA